MQTMKHVYIGFQTAKQYSSLDLTNAKYGEVNVDSLENDLLFLKIIHDPCKHF